MSRKQIALEEKFRRKPKGKHQFIERQELPSRRCFEAEREKEAWFEKNRACTVEDVLKKTEEYLRRPLVGFWTSFQVPPPPPMWEAHADSIISWVSQLEFTGSVRRIVSSLWQTEYTEEYRSFFKIKAVEEFHKRNTPLYKLL